MLGWFWFDFCTGASNVEGAPGVEEAVVDQLEQEGKKVEAEDNDQLEVLVTLVEVLVGLEEVWQGEKLGSEHD